MTIPLESVRWIYGAADCTTSTDPLLQVHRFDEDTFILRQSKCFHYEGNFLYLLFGEQRAILFDSGSPPGPGNEGRTLPLRSTVEGLIESWQADRRVDAIELVVAHTHSHRDHVFWDGQFDGRPDTVVVRPTLSAVKTFFRLPQWPDGHATLSLGARDLVVMPLPGHESTHIAVYDRRTGILLTGDTLYPGLLTVRDWPAYRRSAARLADFSGRHPISHVLGDHIEMTRTPGEIYPIGTRYQPDEHVLPLTAAHIEMWHAACEAMATSPYDKVLDDFIIGAGPEP